MLLAVLLSRSVVGRKDPTSTAFTWSRQVLAFQTLQSGIAP